VRGPRSRLPVAVISHYERFDALVDDILQGVTGDRGGLAA
jgi:hypothetical protein